MAYRIPDHVLRAALEGEEVLLNERTGTYHVLNATGRQVVEALEQGHDTDSVVAAIIDETDGEEAAVVADVASFIESLLERGLLEDRQVQ